MTVEKKLAGPVNRNSNQFFFGEKPEFQSFGRKLTFLRNCAASNFSCRVAKGPAGNWKVSGSDLGLSYTFLLYQLVLDGFDQLLSFLH